MGLSNDTGERTTFVTIVGGKFTKRLNDDDTNPNAIERALTKGPNAGKVVRELQFTTLDGTIKACELQKSDYGESLDITLTDDEGDFVLKIPLESQYFSQVARRLPNVCIEEHILFGLSIDKQRGKPFLYIKQGSNTVHMHFTKDEPHGMPQAQQKLVRGEKKWDFTEQENFLYDVTTKFVEKVAASAPQTQTPHDNVNDDMMEDLEPVDVPDEVPFDE